MLYGGSGGVNTDLVVATIDVQLSKNSTSNHVIQGSVNARQWVGVFHRDIVKATIINAESFRSVFLSRETDTGTKWRIGRFDLVVVEILCKLALQFERLFGTHTINTLFRGSGTGDKMDVVVNGPRRGKGVG